MADKNAFVFCMADGRRVGEAKNFAQFKDLMKKVPLESVLFHANRGDFSNWLAYIGETALAQKVVKVKGSTGSVRTKLMSVLAPSMAKKVLTKIKKGGKK
ncbi:MAG TPA: hypothetical protein ENN60_00710 [archaeon]|nr:hypothetical protein [archaeon]